jgi:hypothetical protein
MWHEGEKMNEYRLFIRKPQEVRPLERPRYGWVDNIKMDLGETVWMVLTGLV